MFVHRGEDCEFVDSPFDDDHDVEDGFFVVVDVSLEDDDENVSGSRSVV